MPKLLLHVCAARFCWGTRPRFRDSSRFGLSAESLQAAQATMEPLLGWHAFLYSCLFTSACPAFSEQKRRQDAEPLLPRSSQCCSSSP